MQNMAGPKPAPRASVEYLYSSPLPGGHHRKTQEESGQGARSGNFHSTQSLLALGASRSYETYPVLLRKRNPH